jgi:hypothetical protein
MIDSPVNITVRTPKWPRSTEETRLYSTLPVSGAADLNSYFNSLLPSLRAASFSVLYHIIYPVDNSDNVVDKLA